VVHETTSVQNARINRESTRRSSDIQEVQAPEAGFEPASRP
jgi:hypothetical protein